MDQSNLHEDMDIHSSFGVHSILLQALVPIRKKDPTVLIPVLILLSLLSKKACRELIQSSTTKRKYSKNWENEFSWLVYGEDINGAFLQSLYTNHSRERNTAHRRCLGHKTIPELEESYREIETS